MKVLEKENYIMISIINYRKVLFSNLKKNDTFTGENIKFILFEKKLFLAVGFNLSNYFLLKEDFTQLFSDNDIYFSIAFIKYKKNHYSFSHFENLIENLEIDVFEEDDIFIFTKILFLQKIIYTRISTFLIMSVLLNFKNISRCLLFTKQLQK